MSVREPCFCMTAFQLNGDTTVLQAPKCQQGLDSQDSKAPCVLLRASRSAQGLTKHLDAVRVRPGGLQACQDVGACGGVPPSSQDADMRTIFL